MKKIIHLYRGAALIFSQLRESIDRHLTCVSLPSDEPEVNYVGQV